ncbi:transmembrane protein 198-like [Nerophis lumbriciformis]|uniref:transmembrane protein 198-like n=1 Tax=Nerophis lumbriciformis TaxID=546530 RepID=UPI002AE05D1D|nr:transmembrane protein 198-like [Nerophis lumbriciformis]
MIQVTFQPVWVALGAGGSSVLPKASAGIGLGIGLLCGLVTMLVRSVGLFMTGLLLGLLLAMATLLLTQQFYTPVTLWVPLGALLGSGMLFAVLTLQWQKLFTVVSTAVFGAAIMTVCADYFVEMLALATHAYECLRLTPGPPLCWYSWVILGIWPALSLVGVLVQWKLTQDSFSHTEVVLSRRQKRVQLMRIRQKDGKKRQQAGGQEGTYRRKATPLKRYAGDLLAPVSVAQHGVCCGFSLFLLLTFWTLGIQSLLFRRISQLWAIMVWNLGL